MPEDFVRLPPDSTGKKVRTFTLPGDIHLEGVVPVGADGNPYPESPGRTAAFASALAAGASASLDSADLLAGTTGRLSAVSLTSSAACKWVIATRDGLAVSTVDVVMTDGLGGGCATALWQPPHPDFVKQIGGAGRGFRVTVTNLDGRNPADVYTTFYFEEVT